MYVNYGDVNFFNYGALVDSNHNDAEYSILYCRPYDDEEDLYQFADCTVDITDSWIDKQDVMSFLDMDDTTFDPIQYAIGCIDYYGADNFGADNPIYDWTRITRVEIENILKNYSISCNRLDITW